MKICCDNDKGIWENPDVFLLYKKQRKGEDDYETTETK